MELYGFGFDAINWDPCCAVAVAEPSGCCDQGCAGKFACSSDGDTLNVPVV